MPAFSPTSLSRLRSCHPDLQRLMYAVVGERDCTILCGHRTEAEQMMALAQGTTKKPWPSSKHNASPSLAVDVVPYPILWPDKLPHGRERELLLGRMYLFVGYIRGVAKGLGISIRCGADWDGDFEVNDQTFHDLPHVELAGR